MSQKCSHFENSWQKIIAMGWNVTPERGTIPFHILSCEEVPYNLMKYSTYLFRHFRTKELSEMEFI